MYIAYVEKERLYPDSACMHDDTLFSVACPDLTIPANGGVVYSDTTIPRAEGSTAIYFCADGYNIVGSVTRTCGANKLWTPDAPTCARE